MRVTELPLAGAKLLEPQVFRDGRGWSVESFSAGTFRKMGLSEAFVLRYESQNERAGTLRGIHFQNPPAGQSKLVQCTKGVLWDVMVDLRKSSATFGKWTAVELKECGPMLYLPAGFGHGFMTLEDDTRVVYLLDQPFCPACAGRLVWDDPTLAITWPEIQPILSEADRLAPRLEQCQVDF